MFRLLDTSLFSHAALSLHLKSDHLTVVFFRDGVVLYLVDFLLDYLREALNLKEDVLHGESLGALLLLLAQSPVSCTHATILHLDHGYLQRFQKLGDITFELVLLPVRLLEIVLKRLKLLQYFQGLQLKLSLVSLPGLLLCFQLVQNVVVL